VRETSNKKILNFENVSKTFDDGSLLKKIDSKEAVKALNEVSFDVYEGETLGLVGESGSGKSTIDKIITGLIKPSSGKISYYNDELFNDRKIYQSQYSRGQIQMIFQDPYSSLNPRFKVRTIKILPKKPLSAKSTF
jgi:peptide/nickel transport system ATP-binding protein